MQITSMLRTDRNLVNRQATNMKIRFFVVENFFKTLYNHYANLLSKGGAVVRPVGILIETYWSEAILFSSFIHIMTSYRKYYTYYIDKTYKNVIKYFSIENTS